MLSSPTVFSGAEAGRRARDRASFSIEQEGRWARLTAKLYIIETENVLGGIINRQPYWRRVFSAAFLQGLRHIDERSVCLDGVRLPAFTGDPAEMNDFALANRHFVRRLTDADRRKRETERERDAEKEKRGII